MTGDLTDCGLPDEYALLRDMLARRLPPGLPVHLIPGNHDRREALIERLHVPHADGFVQYAVDDGPVRLVMLDTVVPGAGHGELCERRMVWLDRTLAARPQQPTLIAMHHPPFLCGIKHMDRISLRQPERFAALVRAHRADPADVTRTASRHWSPGTRRCGASSAATTTAPSRRRWRRRSPPSRHRSRTRWSWSCTRTRPAPSCWNRRPSSSIAGRPPRES